MREVQTKAEAFLTLTIEVLPGHFKFQFFFEILDIWAPLQHSNDTISHKTMASQYRSILGAFMCNILILNVSDKYLRLICGTLSL